MESSLQQRSLSMIILPYFSRISSFFGKRNAPIKGASSFHKGIDIAAPAGTPVYAAADGVITVRESQNGYGNVVYIKHPDGTETRYGHLSAFTDIPAGSQVQAGTQIGFVGSTGRSTGNHLHFEVRNTSGQAVDPQLVFGRQLDNNKNMPSMEGFSPTISTHTQEYPIENTTIRYQHPLAATKSESDDIIAFEYKKRVNKPLLDMNRQPDSFVSLFSGSQHGLLGTLLSIFSTQKSVSENHLTEKSFKNETDSEFLNRPGVQFKLSKTDMKNNGFTDQEISKIARFVQFKQREGIKGTLSQSGQAITPEELALIGLNDDKIELFNRLADIKTEQNKPTYG